MNSLKVFLSANNIRLNKDLGQHFLCDEEVLQKIINIADIKPNDHIIEIGPGIGVLTKELLAKANKVTAIELDARLIPLLKTYTETNPKLNIIEGNALRVKMPENDYKIVANIPYHITSPLLRHVFLESKKPPKSLTLLIQREVAEKICDTKKAGMLTILVNLFGKPKIITHVSPKSFLPPPKVSSSVLHIDCFNKPIADAKTIDKIFQLTKIAFSQKRKKIKSSIGDLPNGKEMLKKAEIDENRRPETLSVEEWIRVAKLGST